MKYKVGDKVRIVKNRTLFMNNEGGMDCYLGTVMTIAKVFGKIYGMEEDNGRWGWNDSMIEGLMKNAEYVKTISRQELKKTGLKAGDIVCLMPWREWGMVTNETNCRAIGTSVHQGFGFINATVMLNSVSQIIFKEDWQDADPIEIIELFRGAENYSDFPISKIANIRMSKYVHAVHFGSSKLYTWRVPQRLEKVTFKSGDIVEVETMHGKQYVQVKETAEYEYDYKTKEVLSLIKTDDLPF